MRRIGSISLNAWSDRRQDWVSSASDCRALDKIPPSTFDWNAARATRPSPEQDVMLRYFVDLDSALAAEDALFDTMGEIGEPVCLFWSGNRGLIAPRSLTRQQRFDDGAHDSATSGWPVSLRRSGGDIVPQGPGTLNLCLVWMPLEPISIEEGYKAICDPIRLILGGECAPVDGCFCDGNYNVVVNGRKVAGTAQRRRMVNGRSVVLAHALILANEDIDAGVDAVNSLQRSIGRGDTVRADAHANASQILGDPTLTPGSLAERISHAMNGAFA